MLRHFFLSLALSSVLLYADIQSDLNKGFEFYEKKEYSDALKIFQPLADQGNISAQHYLGIMHYYGQGVKKDFTKSFKWLLKAAEQGDRGYAEYYVGLMYFNGQGTTKNYLEATKWYTKSAEQNISESQFNLASMYYEGQGIQKDYTNAVTWFTKAAEQGHMGSQYNLALMYKNGKGALKDDNKASQWFRKAAEQGHPSAQYNLAEMYKYGEGQLPTDKIEAAKWYEKAAEQGIEGAQFYLAEMYYTGESIPQDYSKAFKWFSKLLDKKHPNGAQFYVASLYYFGHGVPQDFKEAAKMYTKASDNGLSSAMNNLGLMYANGQGVSQSNIIAYALYNHSSAKDSSSENNALNNRNSIIAKMTNQEIEIGQSLTRNMQTNAISKVITQYLKNQPKASHTKPIEDAKPKASSLYPERPAKIPGKTSCNTRCNNGDCYRTYENGKQKHFQVSPTYNPLNSQFEFNPGPC